MSVALDTPRMLVREIRRGDERRVCDYYVRNEARFVAWDPPRSHDVRTYEPFVAQLERTHDPLVLLAFDRASPETLVGEVVLAAFSFHPPSASLSYTVDAAYEGRGYASEAVAATIAYAFETYGLEMLDATYDPANARSERLLLRLGFALGGRSAVVPGFELLMRANAVATLRR